VGEAGRENRPRAWFPAALLCSTAGEALDLVGDLPPPARPGAVDSAVEERLDDAMDAGEITRFPPSGSESGRPRRPAMDLTSRRAAFRRSRSMIPSGKSPGAPAKGGFARTGGAGISATAAGIARSETSETANGRISFERKTGMHPSAGGIIDARGPNAASRRRPMPSAADSHGLAKTDRARCSSKRGVARALAAC
jgi:hypothetical protein